MVNVSIIGARGYLGRELVKILLQHPEVEGIQPASLSESGDKPFSGSVPAFTGTDLTLRSADHPKVRDADVVFFATSGGQATTQAPHFSGAKLLVDLSRDHRLGALDGTNGWTYGLPEYRLGVPQGTRQIANPGCYPTASLLALGPALHAGLVAPGPVIIDGKSGVSGAGATPRADLHYPETNESVRAYKVVGHDHEHEIQGAVSRNNPASVVRFTPHLVPMNRGLLATVYAPVTPGTTASDLKAAYAEAYAATPFVAFVDEAETAHVRGSNRAHVAVDLDPRSNLLVARGAIDNLLKGGSGAAVQNMNRALGHPETTGLPTIGGVA